MKFRIVKHNTIGGKEYFVIERKMFGFWGIASFDESAFQGATFDNFADAQIAIDDYCGKKVIKKEIVK